MDTEISLPTTNTALPTSKAPAPMQAGASGTHMYLQDIEKY
jgi:hypothetical protein